MRRDLAIGLTAAIVLLPLAATAEDAPQKSERAMSTDSAKSGQSPSDKSERAMSKDAANPAGTPAAKDERAMQPASK